MRYIKVLVPLIIIGGCATITRGTTQTVAIDTPGVPGAMCVIQTQAGPVPVTTPGTATLQRGVTALPIQCTKQCYQQASSIIPAGTETMAAGNVVFGGVIGLGVDAASGAMNRYPDMVTVPMNRDPACAVPGRSPAGRRG